LIIEKEEVLGGVCINTGTFPSKTLREAVLQLTGYHQRKIYDFDIEKFRPVTMDKLHERLNEVRATEHKIIDDLLKSHNVDLIRGVASLHNENCVKIKTQDGKELLVEGEKIILAAGSTPRIPEEIAFDSSHICHSTSILKLNSIPKTLTVIGGGVIGSEYATIYAALGTKVNLIDKDSKPLKYLDTSIINYLKDNFPYDNVKYYSSVKDFKIEKKGPKVHVKINGKENIVSDVLLYALGRKSNTYELELDKIGIELTQFDYIKVNDLYQTSLPHIYAIGDVIGWPSLASTSILQGRLAVLNALKKRTSSFPALFPYGIYTIPEISYIGITEDEAKKKKIHYVVGIAKYDELPRGQISGDLTGILKMVVHAETKEILGIHVIGNCATELIHTAQIALLHNAKANLFVESIFNYPTYSEALKIASYDALSKIKE
jgi:NAD(P) transhydrogenase